MRYGGLIIAIAFAAIAAVIVLRMMANQPKPTTVAQGGEQVKTVNVFVAAKPIPIGVAITQDMIVAQPWPEHLVLDGFIREEGGKSGEATPAGASAVVGMVTRAPFQQQEPLISSKLANPNDPNFLAAELPKGMRVVTIQTSETQGVAGFLFPGDHVDVMMTHDVEKPAKGGSGTSNEKSSVTETVLTNVKVMAVDQHSTNLGATDAQGKLLVPRSATLMVSPADAQRLRLAEKLGTLTLALRSLADRDGTDPLIVTQPSDVTQYQAAIGNSGANAGPVADVVTVYHGVTRDTTVAGTVMPPPTAPVPPAPRVMQ